MVATRPLVKAPLHSTGAASRLTGVASRSSAAGMLPLSRYVLAGVTLLETGRLGATRSFTTGC